ncbi:MAG: DUF1929 domain-containing protein [Deltaproteobacteria bacterium]|nr:DUF1929 domain-containing protein [Deltaproteobacteria bacterium]
MANLPDGRVLAFSSNERNAYPFNGDEFTHASVWDPGTGLIQSVPHPSHDLFCAAVVTLEGGETFVMGGHNGAASPWVSYYDFHANRWIQLSSEENLNRGRWYPTAVYMGSGKVFIAGGIGGGDHPELWTPGVGWRLLTGIDLSTNLMSLGALDGAGNWPLLQLSSDGTIFHHGATPTMNRLDPLGGIGGLGSITDLGPHDFGWFPGQGVSVFYDVGKILVAGGSVASSNSTGVTNATRFEIDGPGPVITPAAPMHFPRVFMNEVVLPTGDVFVVGGNTTGFYFSDWNAVLNPEIWDPDTNTWTLVNPHDQARTYHSTALLLLDGTVISGGGGMLAQPCDGLGSPGECGIDHWNAEIYSPPYLFDADGSLATRPVIGDAPRVARVGRTITVHASPGLSGFSMVRMSGTTHTMNTDQRFFRPPSVEISPGVYSLTLHPNENVLVPGYWMLFALDGEVPSIAKSVQIVNDGTPRGPPIDGRHDEVGDEVLFQVEVEDPDGNPITFSGSGLPDGLTISTTNGVVHGTTTTPGLYNVAIVASDGTASVQIDFQWVVSSERSESGTLTSTPNAWTTVPLLHVYERPVVVMGPPGTNDPAAATVRVRNVTSTSFEYRVESWPYLGSAHGSESISYLVVEAGEYSVPGGGTLVAGIATGIDFQHPKLESFSVGAFVQTPTVLTQVATASAGAGSPPVTTRVESVSTLGFSVRIEEQELGSQTFPAEDVHWIAVEPMAIPGLLETAISPTPVDENAIPVDFGAAFSGRPALFAHPQTIHESDPVTLRLQDTSSAGFRIFAQEEGSADEEFDHEPETFGWLAIDPAATTLALLPLFNEPPSVVTPSDRTDLRGDAVSVFVQASDPEGSSLTFTANGLPPGIQIGASTGELFGTPSTSGSYVVTVRATDPNGDSDFGVFIWTVDEPLELVAFPTPPKLVGAPVDYEGITNIPGVYEYFWDFGDATPPTGPSPSPTAQHVFASPGRYVVTLTVTDPASSQSDTRQFTQIVARAPTATAPTSSSSIAYETANDRVWVVDPDNDSVSVIDAHTSTRIATIETSAGPRTLAVAADGRIWVACREASVLEILDPLTLAVTQTIVLKAGASPYGIVFDPAGTTAFIALEDAGEILRLDGETGALLASQQVGRNVRHLAVTSDGGTLRASRFVTPPLPNEALGVPQSQSGGDLVGGEVLSLDASTLALGQTTILRVNSSPDTEQNARGVPNYLGAPVISPDGTHLVVPSKQDNVLRGGFRDGLPLTHDSTVRAISSRVDLQSGLEDFDARIDYDNASVASATLFSPLGAYAFTTLEGNRQLSIVDHFQNVELARIDTGRAPHGLARSPDGRTLYVDNFMDRSVSVFDLTRLMDSDETALPLKATVSKGTSEALAPNVLLGKQLFYDAADPRLSLQSYVFCAACHADGRQDGRTWDFTHLGQGLRNSIELEGHGQGQGRLHWAGNFDEVQDFEAQIRALGGTGLLSEADFLATQDLLGPPKAGRSVELDALAAYVESLTRSGASPARAGDGTLTPEALVGRALFELARCGRCHRGAQFTDSASGVAHDVGTLELSSGPQTALDTPTLRGLWRTAPYLHDGSAATLEEAIAAHTGIPTLLPAERALLAAYLEQIDDAETTAPNAQPVVVVTGPADGASAPAGIPIDLTAEATDAEEGDLTGAIVWSSDRDGVLGAGGSLQVNGLSVGTHVLTAAVTDYENATGQDSISFTILVNLGPTVTITSPANGSTTTETRPVSLTATASDPEDGDLSSTIVWSSSLSGPLGTGANLNLTTLAAGVHTLTALVLDTAGQPDSDSVELTIAVNAAPSVAITSPVDGSTRTVGTPISLAANAHDPEDGDLTGSLTWTSSLDGALGSGGTLSIDTLSPGVHSLTVAVTDSFGLAGSDQISLTIAVNAPPTVTITAPADGSSATHGASTQLVATASDTEDGDLAASIAWTSSLDGPLGMGGALSISTLSLGSHTLTASVSDSRNESASAQAVLTVVQNEVPILTITAPAQVTTSSQGVPIDFSATALDPEEGELSASIAWSSDRDGPLGIGGSLQIASLSLGRHLIFASVSDSQGGFESSLRIVNILPNASPSVEILSPATGVMLTEGVPVDLVATALDSEDGNLAASLGWSSSLDGPLGTGATIHTNSLSIGSHTLTASVTDSFNQIGSSLILVTIRANAAPSVVITSPVDGSRAEPGALVSFNATASDPEDGDLAASLAWTSSQDGAIGTGPTFALDSLSVGTHTVTAAITDSRGLAGSAQIVLTIAVNAAPTVTISSPADGTTSTAGVVVNLLATASDSEDGELTSSLVWTSSIDGILGTGGALGLGALSTGTHIVTADVTDSQGRAGNAQITLTIEPNTAPTVTISNPTSGSSQTRGDSVLLSATATDSEDGDLASSIRWSSSLGDELGVGASLIRSDLSIGIHTLTASVTDSLGLENSAQATLTIHANAPPVVTITSPAASTTVPEGSSVPLSATATDPEDGDLSSGIHWISSVQGALGTGASLVLDDPQIGFHRISASVTDRHGASHLMQVDLAVAANLPPNVTLTIPSGFMAITPSETLELVATAIDPEDGDLGPNVVWTSNLDGVLGSGSHISAGPLSLGLHDITVSVSDSRGRSGSARTLVSVPEPGFLAASIAGAALLASFGRRGPSGARRRERDQVPFESSGRPARWGRVPVRRT